MRTLPLLLVALWCVQPREIRAATPLQMPDLTPIYHATVVISDTSADPITQADALVSDDVRAVLANKGRVDALATAKSDYEASQAKLKTDRAARDALLDPLAPVTPTPGPGPGPGPSGHTVQILAFTDPATCPPCKQLAPVLASGAAAGVNIQTVSLSDPRAAALGIGSEPSLVMLVDGAEPNNGKTATNTRVIGYSGTTPADAAAELTRLKIWYAGGVDWASKLPPSAPKAER